MALMLREALPKGSEPRLKFSLPGKNIHVEVEAEVAWVDVKGLAGFRFRNISKTSKEELERWLDEHMEQQFPGAKQRFAAAEVGSSE
jgi:hypothetical protein